MREAGASLLHRTATSTPTGTTTNRCEYYSAFDRSVTHSRDHRIRWARIHGKPFFAERTTKAPLRTESLRLRILTNTDEAECAEAAKHGRIEFEVADIKAGPLYTVNDVIALAR